ncbi:DUF3592 domain-containing protein [Nocardiopsis dassonvillei]|uniref:DUF3592 domain-containing protein n=1 Tax=Nocardiopsis dassonvillei TaxID=2014 RepID=UPI00200C6B64|nr:DUF3592 domain-containing protein [Nocardiopsis dassonvillei]MCK9870642.1 DUF3592 domain-containing protein [Nocardiopsis dassonvillei]
MDFDRLFLLAVVVAVSAFAVHRAVRRLRPVLAKRREQRRLDVSGVRARGVVRTVHDLGHGPTGRTVTVDVGDGGGRVRQAVDASGMDGYLVREGVSVELVHAPDALRSARVERAALPAHGGGDYPVYPRGRPGFGPALLTAALPALVVLPVAAVLGAAALSPPELVPRLARFLPLALPVAGASLVAIALRWVVAGRLGPPRHTAEAEGTVTDRWTERRRVSGGGTVSRYPFNVYFWLPDGREVHRRYRFASAAYRPSPGQRVRVRYDPGAPTRFTVRDFTPGWAVTAFVAAAGCLLAAVGVVVSLVALAPGGS